MARLNGWNKLTEQRPEYLDWANRWRAGEVWRDQFLDITLRAAIDKHGSKLAIVDAGTRLSFEEFDAAVDAIAKSLASLGIGEGDVVAFQLPTWWEAIVISHASFRLRTTLLPIGPNLGAHELGVIFGLVRPSVFFLPEEFRGITAAHRLASLPLGEGVTFTVRANSRTANTFEELLQNGRTKVQLPMTRGDTKPIDAAVLLFTSGSTATPKGVLHSHNTLSAEAVSLRDTHSLGVEDVVLMPYPINHVGGFSYAVLAPFVSGALVVLMERWDAAAALKLMSEEGVTFFSAVPSVVRSLVEQPNFGQLVPPTVRTVALGGTRVTRQEVAVTAEAFCCEVKRGYGLTEMPTFSSTRTIGRGDDEEAATDGRPAGSSVLRIVDADGRECSPETVGEIQVQGPELFIGYLQPELNAESFSQSGYFRTGDLGSVDIQGRLRVRGRIKDVIIRNGENISAAELEEVVLLHPNVTDVAVIGVPDEQVGERVCAIVQTGPDASLNLKELREFLLQKGIAKFKLPEVVHLRDALPRTANEKIDKRALREDPAYCQAM